MKMNDSFWERAGEDGDSPVGCGKMAQGIFSLSVLGGARGFFISHDLICI